MNPVEAKHLQSVEAELRFIARYVQTVEGNGSSDFDRIDEIDISGMLRSLSDVYLP